MTQIPKTLYRIFCCYTDKPVLRNFDKVINIADSFKNGFSLDYDPDVKILDHSRKYDLCPWSYQLIGMLSELDGENDVKVNYRVLIGHLSEIKQFYAVFSKEESHRIKKFVSLIEIIQAYECIVSLAFEYFFRNENTMIEINNLLKILGNSLEEYNKKCFTLVDRIGNRGIYKEIDSLILQLNSKFGDYDLLPISDFIKELGAFMCKYVSVQMSDYSIYSKLSENIIETAQVVHEKLVELDPDYDQMLSRRSKNSHLLTITKKIEKNLEKFGSKELVIRKVYLSFEQIYKSLFKVKEDLEDIQNRNKAYEINFKKVNTSFINNLVKDIDGTRVFVEDIETIIFFLIFYFENREEVLFPLSGHLDEISRIMEKYLSFHIVYRITYAANYLSKAKSVVNRIISLFEKNLEELENLIFVMNELKRRYLDLIILDSIENVNRLSFQRPESLREVAQELDDLFVMIIEELKND
ncbi:unnamed protein product [Brachionus calyciflorus]|uniref:Uncharacterized protein n=1 Tax=Brachionus calyciflorus TaxID=104777 RepID=A0A813RCL7_9BILA|nr:unnamed protein product [Brachionus calyciflorus]